jgi:hypothetical protein
VLAGQKRRGPTQHVPAVPPVLVNAVDELHHCGNACVEPQLISLSGHLRAYGAQYKLDTCTHRTSLWPCHPYCHIPHQLDTPHKYCYCYCYCYTPHQLDKRLTPATTYHSLNATSVSTRHPPLSPELELSPELGQLPPAQRQTWQC